MKVEQVLQTYDASYADEYNHTFLIDAWTKPSVAFQLELLGQHLSLARNWLDVACGTGYVLSQFPGVERAGLDLSEPMLEVARKHNPGSTFVRRNYREPFPEFDDKWDVVSCMWWAYCMAETMSEIQQLVARLADWTSPEGIVFLPLCNPNKFDRHNTKIPYIDPLVPGRCMITGITWTWIQENGKRHDDVLSPQVEHMVAMFRQHFDSVTVVEGPLDVVGEGWRVQDVLIARGKKAIRTPGDLYPTVSSVPPGQREWLLGVGQGALAGMSYPAHDLEWVRIAIERIGAEPWAVQVSKIGYEVVAGEWYRLRCGARADSPRVVGVGVALGHEPWSGLGLYQSVEVGPEWTEVDTVFRATGTSNRARVHFDAGQSLVALELRNVTLEPSSPPS